MTDLVRVGDILTQIRLPIHLSVDVQYTPIGIRSFGRGIFHYNPGTPEVLSKLRYFQIPSNALALSNIKAWEGAIALTGNVDTTAIASNRFLFYKPRDNRTDIRYLLYYFLSEPGISLIGSASPGSADRNRTLGIKAFEDLRINFPEAYKQQKIADKLDALLGRADAVQELRVRSTSLRASLTESLIEDAATSAIETVRVGEIVTFERAPIAIEPDSEYRTIGVRSFGKGFIHHPTTKGENLSKLKYFHFHAGALALSNLMAWEGGITVTRQEDTRYIASNRFFFYLPTDDRVNVSFLRHFLLSRRGQVLIASACSSGAERNRTLGRSRFEALTIPLPPRAEQDRVAWILDSLNERVSKVHADPALEALRPSILNAAFTGQL